MKKPLASVLCAVMAVGIQAIALSATGKTEQGAASLSGVANGANSSALSGVRVQLRNVDTGQLSGSTTSATNGAYSFAGLAPGNYIVEIVDATGKIIGTSSAMSVAAGAAITGVTVAASAAGAVAAAAAAGGMAAFFTSTGGILVLAGVAVGVAAGVAATNDAS